MKYLSLFLIFLTISCIQSKCPIEESFIKNKLVNVKNLDSTLHVDLMYSSVENMFGKDMYECLEECYVQPEVAEMVVAAQKKLREKYPVYSMKLFDGARPRSVQKKMWAIVKGTSLQSYVANPARGSMHNYGAAVDITVVNEKGEELDMGQPDPCTFLLDKSDAEIKRALSTIKLSAAQKKNRQLLKTVMMAAGFYPFSLEWWHFRAFPKEEARKRYRIIE
jgi:D-alanyl-D-alanine dipeptidase